MMHGACSLYPKCYICYSFCYISDSDNLLNDLILEKIYCHEKNFNDCIDSWMFL